ncbi:hypothetical protein IE53DRAFT_369881 [Violaceomyces palustris]|uniref:Uncharacterized protein n=1 Tax=Violaceomyces palustris TaxID=1673888 RepID=A0ACD0NU38_9BASI|nr:hypothetical protein IE53DRAFT_369881 [Violaceomyces palustris]
MSDLPSPQNQSASTGERNPDLAKSQQLSPFQDDPHHPLQLAPPTNASSDSVRQRRPHLSATSDYTPASSKEDHQTEKLPPPPSPRKLPPTSSSPRDHAFDSHVKTIKPSHDDGKKRSDLPWYRFGFKQPPKQLAWIPATLTWPKLKPVLRSSLVAWICMLFMLINPVERMLGNASFLVLVGAFIQPAELPLVAVAEREFFTLLFAVLSWAWCCIAIKISHSVRTNAIPQAEVDPKVIFEGYYIQARPAVVCAVFLSFGAATLLYTKVRFGPGPFLFATIFSCILMNVTLTYTPLFPYTYYMLSTSIIIPLAVKAAVNIVISALFFPKSVNSQYCERLVAVLDPLAKANRAQIGLLKTSPLDDDFDFNTVRSLVDQSEAGLMPLQMSSRLITRELSFGLANGEDLKSLERLARSLVGPADGWSYYLSMIKADITNAHFPKTPLPSHLVTPIGTPGGTPRTSQEHERPTTAGGHVDDERPGRGSSRLKQLGNVSRSGSPSSSIFARNHHSHHHSHNYHHHHHRNSSKHHLHLHLHGLLHKHETAPVGVWESIRFANLEAHLHTASSNPITEMFAKLLQETSKDILEANAEGIEHISSWAKKLNSERFAMIKDRFFKSKKAMLEDAEKQARTTQGVIQDLEDKLEKFRTEQRLCILEPFRAPLEGQHSEPIDHLQPGEISKVHHRYLYQVWLHQFHTMTFSERLLSLLKSMEEIEKERTKARLWGPSLPRLLTMDTWKNFGGEHDDEGAEEDPDTIPNYSTSKDPPATELGQTRARDPDALDPENSLELLGQKAYFLFSRLFQGHLLFGVKAAALVALVSLPAFLKSSAGWAYRNRAIWSIFMAQLTLARFRGETAFALFSRIVATTLGAAIGLVIWYISAGNGLGNVWGMAVTTAIAFPILFLIRLYYPGPPITSIITTVTVGLVVGYSWKDTHNPAGGSPGYGWDVAWRRFVTVIIGVVAAFIFALLPPSKTLREHQRLSHSTTIAELGEIYCKVVALASGPHGKGNEEESLKITKRSLALRAKLRRLNVASANVAYEFSLRGKWPTSRYQELFNVQMEISKLLNHCVTVIERLGPAYSKALLRRTRFLDPLFLGDVISVIQMCSTALRTASPLPQITPCPLVDRFLLFEHGFAITRDDEADDLGLPRTINLSTLSDQEYMYFAVGVSSFFGLVSRLDKLCVTVKELVGESYAIPADVHRINVIRGSDWSRRQW